MNYIDYIKSTTVDGEKIFEDFEITEETNYNMSGDKNSIIIKKSSGVNTKSGKVVPIEWRMYTSDINSLRETLEKFTKQNNTKQTLIDDKYLQEFYNTDFVSNTFNQIGINYTHEVIMTGTLIISSDISDIVTIKVNGYEIETLTRNLIYSTQQESQKVGNNYLNETEVLRGNLTLNLTLVNKTNNYISTILRSLRQGLMPVNTKFDIEVIFVDGSTEKYKMSVISSSLNSDNQRLPFVPVSFMK